MPRKLSYGEDVTWQAGETAAFLIYNRLCRNQAAAAFAASINNQPFSPVPAIHLAERARKMAA